MTYLKIFRKRQFFLCFIFLFCFAQLMAKEEENINIKEGEVRKKEEEIKDFKKDSEEVGIFAKTANAVVLIKEKKLKNDGKIISRLTGTAKEVKGSSKEGAMHVEGQGNGVVSIGYSPFSNNRDINKQLELIENNGSINVNSTFQGGKAEVHGFVETVATGNGVLLYGLSDYGSTIGGDGGSGSIGGGVDSLGGGTKIRRPVIKNKTLPVTTTAFSNATTLNSNNSGTEKQNENSDKESSETDKKTASNHNFGSAHGSSDPVNPALEGWLAPIGKNKVEKQSKEKEKEKEKKNGKNKPKDTTKIDEVDLHGKNNVMTLLKMDNKGNILVNLDIKTSEGYKRETSTDLNGHKVEEHIQPQWRSIATLSSGNGISGLSYVTTPTRRTYGEGKENRIEIKEIDNNGNISAKSNFKTRDYATVNYIHTFATGNGISVLAYTNNNAKNKTYAIIDKITNTGTISGKVNSEVGSNTSSGFHEYSTNKMNATGNGISVYAHNSNGQVKENDARIDNLLNSGSISGDILAKSGKGYGDLSAKIVASGNGVSVYSTGTNQKSTLKKLENSGYIVGHAVVYGGQAKGSETENQTKFNIEITSKKDKKDNSDASSSNATGNVGNIGKLPSFKDKTTKKDKKNNSDAYSSNATGNVGNIGNLPSFKDKTSKKDKKKEDKPSGNPFNDNKDLSKWIQPTKVETRTPTNQHTDAYGIDYNGLNGIGSIPPLLPKKEDKKAESKKDQTGSNDYADIHKKNTIQALTEVIGSGNGISVITDNDATKSESKVNVEEIKNTGVISGYSEIYRGRVKNEDQRVVSRNSGAGIVFNDKVKTNVHNDGIISGSNCAILTPGKKDDSSSLFDPDYKTNFEGKVVNNGIMAGQLIMGAYYTEANDKDNYRYFDALKEENKFVNNGLYIKLDKDGKVTEVIPSKIKNERMGDKIIENLTSKEATYDLKKENKIQNKIINGVGEKAVIDVTKNLTIENTTINAYQNAIKLNGHTLSLKNTTLNTNAFGESFAISGEGNNNLILDNNTVINGKIKLGSGNDTIELKGNVKFNSEVDLGEGKNTLKLIKDMQVASLDTKEDISILGKFKNINEIELGFNAVINSDSRFDDVENIKVAEDATITFELEDENNHALVNHNNKSVKISGNIDLKPNGDKIIIGYTDELIKALDISSKDNKFFIDKRAIPTDKKLNAAFDSYITSLKNKGSDSLAKYKVNENVFKAKLDNIVNENVYALNKTSFLDNISENHRNIFASNDFIAANKFKTLFNYNYFNKDYHKNISSASHNFNVGLVYGLSDKINLGAVVNYTKNNLNLFNEKYSKNIYGVSALAKIKINDLMDIDEMLSYTKTDNLSVLNSNTRMSKEFNFNNSIIRPSLNLNLARINQKAVKDDVINIDENSQFYANLTCGLDLGHTFELANSKIKVFAGTELNLYEDDIKTLAYFDKSKTFVLNNYQAKNLFRFSLGTEYIHTNGFATKVFLNKAKNSINYGIDLKYSF